MGKQVSMGFAFDAQTERPARKYRRRTEKYAEELPELVSRFEVKSLLQGQAWSGLEKGGA